MPELPDLQAFSHNLQNKLSGKKVMQVTVTNAKKLNVSASVLNGTLVGQKVEKVYREGKELHIKFNKGDVLGLHLMLHGKLFLFEGKNDNKYSIIELHFEDNSSLVLTDFQGIAKPTLNPEPKDVPDALEVDAAFFTRRLAKTKTNIKTVLLDQKILRGIGNAYADEILWQARISPFSISNKIPEAKLADLAKAIKEVLHDAEKSILHSNPDIINGEVRDFMKIHNAKKKQSPTGHDIIIKESSRKTYYTEEQKLFE
ncbi:formamidopyrimidine-DNA glycosylase [Mucilaginibacter oryzae]|uniref:Formamidopyrimidine-DNA glycosylase n=1 Tax=Mucilaginibacter oryzae TaxID=468058 RepID=A0A316HF96_9SPHI|nr:DNA-formamidopyrimidine glycosylase family protein [Mucilaginibacter oryzae]PWK78843.1 formamidopyrimidine-DNA glycosylase [Mucilaginibacter oryzae]